MTGKDYGDFDVIGDNYITEKDLEVGDFFCKDTYPEVYQVTSFGPDPLGDMVNVLIAKCITDDHEGRVFFFFKCDSLLQLKPKE